MQLYDAFGLRVRSGIDLPELFKTEGESAADVVIELGTIDASATDGGLTVVAEGLLLTIPDVARFLVSGGDRIIIDQSDGVDPRNLRLFLLGSAFGALLHQRGLLPLHANSVEIGGKAIAFMGASGAGKSTLAAWFHDKGCRILGDDICAIKVDSGGPIAFRGVARLRLWRDALEASGRRADDHMRSAMLDSIRDKFDLPLPVDCAAPAQLPLAAVYVLDQDRQFSIDRMRGVAAAEALFANTYRGSFIDSANNAQAHFTACTLLANTIPIYRLCRAWGLVDMHRQNALIMGHALSVAAGAVPAGED